MRVRVPKGTCIFVPLLLAVLMGLSPMLVLGQSAPPAAPPSPSLSDGTDGPSAPGTFPQPALGFIENRGQLRDEAVRFFASMPGGRVAFKDGSVVLTLVGPMDGRAEAGPAPSLDGPDRRMRGGPPFLASGTQEGCNVVLSFQDARDVAPRGVGRLPWDCNFLIGNDPSGWRADVPCYGAVVYEGLYEGIDLVYRLENDGPKYELVLAPSADLSAVDIRVEGQGEPLVSSGGSLRIPTSVGTVTDSGLRAFYLDGPGEEVPCSFELHGEGAYGFEVMDYNRTRSLVVDPLLYSTLLGGFSDGLMAYESGNDIAVDDAMCAHVCGGADSRDFPTTPGAFQRDLAGTSDAFVCKMEANGSALEYCTFIGGSGNESAFGIHLGPEGTACVGGYTDSADFPMTADAIQGYSGRADSFLVELEADGSSLLFSTCLGGSEDEWFGGMDIDASGGLCVAGATMSTDLPVTPGAYQVYLNGYYNAFVARLDPMSHRLIYLTYLGGSDGCYIFGAAIDHEGEAFVCGAAYGAHPTTKGALREARWNSSSSEPDGFVTKLSADGSALEYSTYCGPRPDEGHSLLECIAVSVNPTGNAVVLGDTYTTKFIYTLSADGGRTESSRQWRGALGFSYMYDMELAINGDICITGSTNNFGFPTTPDAFQHAPIDGTDSDDAFALVLDTDLEIVYSTLIGGNGTDQGMGIAADRARTLYVTGSTNSSDFPTTEGAYQPGFGGGIRDAFVTRLPTDHDPPSVEAGDDIIVDQHTNVSLDGWAADNVGIKRTEWRIDYGPAPQVIGGQNASFVFDEAGRFLVTFNATDFSGNTAQDTLNVTVRDTTPPVADAGPPQSVGQGEPVRLDGSGSSDNVGIVGWVWELTYKDIHLLHLSGPTPICRLLDAGDYNVNLTVLDAAGLHASATTVVHVLDTTPPMAHAVGTQRVPQHEIVSFDGSASSDNVGVVRWKWSLDYGDTQVELFGMGVTFKFDEAGVYVVTMTVTDAAGNSASTDVTVTVLDTTPPVADAGWDKKAPQHSTVLLDGSLSRDNVGISSWLFTFVYDGTDVELHGPIASFTFDIPGIYQVELRVTDSSGLRGTDIVVVEVGDNVPPVAEAGADVTIPQHSEVVFDGRLSTDNVAVANWTWELSYGGLARLQHGPVHLFRFDLAGAYEVRLTARDAVGLSSTDTMRVIVLDTEPPRLWNLTDLTVVEGARVELNASSATDNVGVVGCVWTFDLDGRPIALDGLQQSYTFNRTGAYHVWLNVTDAAGNVVAGDFMIRVTRSDGGGEDGDGAVVPDVGQIAFLIMLAVLVLLVLSIARLRGRARR